MTWILFILTAGIIVVAGARLALYGDIVAERSGLGRTLFGLIVVAATTSLPELFTGISSSAIHRLPDIAIGDIVGSCMFNLLILSIMDVVSGRAPVSSLAHQGHTLSIGLGMILVSLVGIAMAAGPVLPAWGWISPVTPVLVLVYLSAVRLTLRYERRRRAGAPAPETDARHGHITTRSAMTHYAIMAVIVVVAALFLPGLGARIAAETGMGQAFVGSLFIAATTSLPEVVVSLAAVRLGAVELALGNVLGSNLFNMLILALDDALYTAGPIFGAAHPSHIVSIMATMAMYGALLVGITYQAMRKLLMLAWDTAAIGGLYVAAILLLYLLRAR